MKKKKIIGYTCGTFDLFHIGHLNILKKARSMCNYLIVGINSDETIFNVKNKHPVIPFEERKEILESIKYVDEVIKVECSAPFQKGSDYELRKTADIVFSGNDHENDPDWIELKNIKEQNGTKLIMLPYTKTTSSTLIRKTLDKLDSN